MLRWLLVQNGQGKVRLAKYYARYTPEEQTKLALDVYRLIAVRDQHTQSNFVEVRAAADQYGTYQVVYRRYAALLFSVGIDQDDNPLAYLEAIHLFVEVLDTYFANVCELDLVFQFHRVYAVLDELFLAGEIQEPSKSDILARLQHCTFLG